MGWGSNVFPLLIITPTGGFTGLFLYSPAPGTGNLIGSWTSAAGTDPYGNSFPAGINVTAGQLSGVTIAAINETLNPGPLLEYGTSNPTVQVLLTGAGNFTMPAGVTSVFAECWGSGQTGATSSGGFSAGNGGIGGEYAAEPALAVTPGNLYAFSQGTGGGNSTFAGDVVTVTAHGGNASGTGSTNTKHFNGGASGAGAGGSPAAGGGGGSSAGTASAGNAGGTGTAFTAGAGGAAPSGGGAGGTGGTNGIAGVAGSAPGGGGGGGGGGTHPGGAGAAGQIRLTYTPTGGATALYAALATFANTDASGNAWNAGLGLLKTVYALVGSPAAPEVWHTPALNANFANGGQTPQFQLIPLGGGRVQMRGAVNITGATAANTTMFTLPAGYHPTVQSSWVTANNITGYVAGNPSVNVLTTGDVQLVVAATAGKFVTLDGIFPPLD